MKVKKKEKPIDVGFQCIWNEAPIIRGWARTMLYFCKRVYAIIDPETDDETEKILEEEFPEINILWQDPSLGDSTDRVKGPQGHLQMHENNNAFVKEYIKENEWMLFLAADERFHPSEFETIVQELEQAKLNHQRGIVHYVLYDFIQDNTIYVKYHPGWINHLRFYQKENQWIQRPGTHGGKIGIPNFKKCFSSESPLYHYHMILPHKPDLCWRYTFAKTCDFRTLERENNGKLPVNHYKGKAFEDWKELESLI